MQEGISLFLKYVSIIKRQRRAEDILKFGIIAEKMAQVPGKQEALSTSTCLFSEKKSVSQNVTHRVLMKKYTLLLWTPLQPVHFSTTSP
jgi:hypothetical protein